MKTNTSSHFPLYNIILSQVNYDLEEISGDTKEILAKDIKNLNQECQERIYGIIKSYDIDSQDPTSVYELPYSGRQLKSGIKFDIDSLPLKLQHMLLTFLTVHKDSVE